ncbi:MAG: SUMF1/EgtB/PvdO family nonheme iron enzyme [Myxococcales bacterium]|jgi:formylglycine-generating enzyme required for sulfatase activity
MRRTLLGAGGICKQTAIALVALSGAFSGCGGAVQTKVERDPYGPRVANCIDTPRPISDAAFDAMVPIQAGPAVLGSTPQERAQARRDYGLGGQGLFENEEPVRRVQVHGFRIDRTPVTAEAYAEFVAACGALPPDNEAITAARWRELQNRFGLRLDYGHIQRFLWNGREPIPERARHPMVLVTQDEAAFYCAWRGARLPTEVEWERAARGPNGNIYPWGSRFDAFRVNTSIRGEGDTIEVGSLPHGNSPEGVSDMGGHVYEWTATAYPGQAGQPAGQFVVKGNGWDGRGGYGRGAARLARPGEMKDVTLGFRCAAD